MRARAVRNLAGCNERMRISQIASWSECEAMALQSPPRIARTHVAAYVGTLAHALVADLPKPLPEGRIGFDATTPTLHTAAIQARNIARYARMLLSRPGTGAYCPVRKRCAATTYVGHLDIRAWHSDDGEAIIDLKGWGADCGGLVTGGWLPSTSGRDCTVGRRAARTEAAHL